MPYFMMALGLWAKVFWIYYHNEILDAETMYGAMVYTITAICTLA